MKHLQDATTLQTVVATNIKEYFPASLRFLFTLLMEKKGGDRVRLRDGDIWFQQCLRQHASAAPPEAQIDGGDPALLLCTGGTTGTPKAAIQTHRALLITGMQGKTWSGPSIPDDTSTVLLAIPLFHTYGNSLLLPTTIVGRNAAALVPNPQDLDDVIRTIEKVRPTMVPGIPALYIKLLEHRKVKAGKVNLRSIKSWPVVGGTVTRGDEAPLRGPDGRQADRGIRVDRIVLRFHRESLRRLVQNRFRRHPGARRRGPYRGRRQRTEHAARGRDRRARHASAEPHVGVLGVARRDEGCVARRLAAHRRPGLHGPAPGAAEAFASRNCLAIECFLHISITPTHDRHRLSRTEERELAAARLLEAMADAPGRSPAPPPQFDRGAS